MERRLNRRVEVHNPGSIRMHRDHDEIMKGNASFNPCQLNIFFTSPESLSTELNKGFEITRFYTTKEPCLEDSYS